MKSYQLLIFAALFSFGSAAYPQDANSCLPDYSLCGGSPVFIRSGTVILPGIFVRGNPLTVQTHSVTWSPKRGDIASGHPGFCSKGLHRFCPGDGTERKEAGIRHRGEVIGVFPSSDSIVIIETSGRPRLAKLSSLKHYKPTEMEDTKLGAATFNLENLREYLPRVTPAPSPTAEPECDDDGQPPAQLPPNAEYFRKVLAEGPSAPLEDFLHFWDPLDEKVASSDYLEACDDKANHDSPFRISGDEVDSACTPAVLYSWGPDSKRKTFEQTLGNAADWNVDPNPGKIVGVYGTFSPVATYTYGIVPIRMKMLHTSIPRGFSMDSPYSLSSDWGDFLIRKASVIESWSFGTPEHYDEIVKDLKRLLSDQLWYGYFYEHYDSGGTPRDPTVLEGVGVAEVLKRGQDTVKAGLLNMISMILNREGRVYYAPGICKNRAKHFFIPPDRQTYFSLER